MICGPKPDGTYIVEFRIPAPPSAAERPPSGPGAQRKMQQGDQPAGFSLPAWEEIRAEPEFSQRK
jgi:hypothetical protein